MAADRLVAADPTCWLAQFTDTPCDGALVRCHVLQRQWLRQEYPEGAVWLEGTFTAVSARVLRRDHIAVEPAVLTMSLPRLENHPRLWEWGCGGAMGNGGHHGSFDGYKLPVPRIGVCLDTRLFIARLGLTAKWERDRRFSEVPDEWVLDVLSS